jgi:hypothetical protein
MGRKPYTIENVKEFLKEIHPNKYDWAKKYILNQIQEQNA